MEGRGCRTAAWAICGQAPTRRFPCYEIPLPCLAEPERQVCRKYDVNTSLISLFQHLELFGVDKAGVVRYTYVGWQQSDFASVRETLHETDALGRWCPSTY